MDHSAQNQSENLQTPSTPAEQRPQTLIEKYGKLKVFITAVIIVAIIEAIAIYFVTTDADLKFFGNIFSFTK